VCLHRREVKCGPHRGSTPIDTVIAYVATLPAWCGFIFSYLQNVVLLWLLILCAVVYTAYLAKRETFVCALSLSLSASPAMHALFVLACFDSV
jgi:hypothetical protein